MGNTYHRCYRHLSAESADVGRGMLLGLLPAVLLLAAAPAILQFHGRWVSAILEWIGIPLSQRVSYFWRLPLVVPDVVSYAPSHSLYPALVALLGWIVALVLLMPLSHLTPWRVIGGVAALVSGVSGTFFYFAGERG
jgi:hypothetical protein